MLPFYVKDPRLREGDNVKNLRKTLAFARVTTVKKEGNDVQNLKDPRLREGDKCNKNESGNVQNLRKTLASARVTTVKKRGE